jgi:hypothetical protein
MHVCMHYVCMHLFIFCIHACMYVCMHFMNVCIHLCMDNTFNSYKFDEHSPFFVYLFFKDLFVIFLFSIFLVLAALCE